jgi:hypothetical protein
MLKLWSAVALATGLGADGARHLRTAKSALTTTSVSAQQTLRICNAYPYEEPLDVLLNEQPFYKGLTYKSCMDFEHVVIKPGDMLRFKTIVDHDEYSAGLFEIADPPPFSSTMLLVVQRHDTLLNAVSFESHVFRQQDEAQVAVIDAYRGVDKAQVRIMHSTKGHPDSAPERLPFGSVHRINLGQYELALDESRGKLLKQPFVALPKHTYVVLRVGLEDNKQTPNDKASFDEDMLVFPLSSDTELRLVDGHCDGYMLKKVWEMIGVC